MALPASLLLVALSVTPTHAADISLSLPVDCTLRKTCFVQNYVDMVPGPEVGDYACGQASYDGHKGTDFRLLSVKEARKQVAVLAAAPGRVRAVRDGVVDKLLTDTNDPSVKGRECGNGVVVDHDGGWQTQYCHLLEGSVGVAKGDRVARGAKLGAIGFSGHTQFAHLHMSVRHNGKVMDPFMAAPIGATCDKRMVAGKTSGLWDAGLSSLLAYKPGELIAQGFSGAVVKSSMLERGTVKPLTTTSNALIFYVRFINLQKGDAIRLSLTGPAGFTAQNTTESLTRSKAQYVAYVGKKRRAKAWPPGRYTSKVDLVRGDDVVISAIETFDMPTN